MVTWLEGVILHAKGVHPLRGDRNRITELHFRDNSDTLTTSSRSCSMAALGDKANEVAGESSPLASGNGNGGVLQHSAVNVGINGFGRIGRAVLRVILKKGTAGTPLRVRAINAPGKTAVKYTR